MVCQSRLPGRRACLPVPSVAEVAPRAARLLPTVRDGGRCRTASCARNGRRGGLMGSLDGKVALVTGGGRGIGRGIVLEFARAGANVAINYRRDRDAAEATAREIEALGRSALVVQADVGDREAV